MSKSSAKSLRRIIETYIMLIFLGSIGITYNKSLAVGKNKKKATNSNHSCFKPNNPVCQAIYKLSPHVSPSIALRYSNAFVKVARRQKVPVQLLIAIAKQESDFRLEAVRNVKGLILNNGIYKDATVGSDFCMMQINVSNINNLKLDASRLLTEPEYCVEAGARILNYFKRNAKKDISWWTRYNAFSDLHRKVYLEHVLKHWRKIDPAIDSIYAKSNTIKK